MASSPTCEPDVYAISDRLLSALRHALGSDQLTAQGVRELRNTFREDAPMGFLHAVHAACLQGGTIEISPDAVYHNALVRFADTLKRHAADYIGVFPQSHKQRGAVALETTSPSTPPSVDELTRDLARFCRSESMRELITDVGFATTNEASRRAFLVAFLAQPLDESAPFLPTWLIPTVSLHASAVKPLGTGADWMLLKQRVSMLFTAFPPGIFAPRDVQIERRFSDAVDCLLNIMASGSRPDDEQQPYCTNGQEAWGWLLDLALVAPASPGSLDRRVNDFKRDVRVLPYVDRASGAFRALVCAQQSGRFLGEAVLEPVLVPAIEVFAEKSWRKMIERATCSIHEPTGHVHDRDAFVKEQTIDRESLLRAIDARDVNAALLALSHMTNGNELLLAMIMSDNWSVARNLAERIIVPGDASASADGPVATTFVPARGADDSDSDSDDDGVKVADSVMPASDEVVHIVVGGAMREFTVPALPRLSLLRLQHWALNEMIAYPDLDLTGLTSMNAGPNAGCTHFRVHVEVSNADTLCG